MYMAFLTQDKVGLQILPFDGNPHQSTALIAHPGGVSHKNLNGSFICIINTPDCKKSTQVYHINMIKSYFEKENIDPLY